MFENLDSLEKTRPCAHGLCENIASLWCSKCQTAKYCSEQCRVQHLPEHEPVCRPNQYSGTHKGLIMPSPQYQAIVQSMLRGEDPLLEHDGIHALVRKPISGRLFQRASGTPIYEDDIKRHNEESKPNRDRVRRLCGLPVMLSDPLALFEEPGTGRFLLLNIRTDSVEEFHAATSSRQALEFVIRKLLSET